MDSLGQALTIARFDLGTALRTRRALAAALLYAAFALGTGAVLVWVELQVRAHLGSIQGAVAAAAASGEYTGPRSLEEVIAFLLGGDMDLARSLIGVPLVVYGFFWVTTTLLPYLVALVSIDAVAGELRERSVRFSLLRTSRGAFLGGKALAHLTLLVGVTIVSNLLILGLAWVKLPAFDLAPVGLYLVRTWAFTLVFGLAYLGLTLFVSSLVSSPGLGLILNVIALIGLSVLSAHPDWGGLSPSSYKLGLWLPRLGDALPSLAAYAGFAVIFLGAAWATLRARDV